MKRLNLLLFLVLSVLLVGCRSWQRQSSLQMEQLSVHSARLEMCSLDSLLRSASWSFDSLVIHVDSSAAELTARRASLQATEHRTQRREVSQHEADSADHRLAEQEQEQKPAQSSAAWPFRGPDIPMFFLILIVIWFISKHSSRK